MLLRFVEEDETGMPLRPLLPLLAMLLPVLFPCCGLMVLLLLPSSRAATTLLDRLEEIGGLVSKLTDLVVEGA